VSDFGGRPSAELRSGPALSIGITTRDRQDALRRCFASLQYVAHLQPEILVFDDASTIPAECQLPAARGVRFIRDEKGPGYIAGRNALVDAASAPAILLLDDDALLLDGAAVSAALAVLAADDKVGAVAFAQAAADGTPWPDAMQPARARVAARVPSYIGFAHLLRRDIFLALGGYRERFKFYGEEKDYALRLLDAGFLVVYLPNARIGHQPDPAGRDRQRYLRFVTRNDCLSALYNEPLTRLMWILPARGVLYFRMRRQWRIADPWGWAWIARDLASNLLPVLKERRAVSRATIAEWKRLRANPVPYVRAG
jgi:GT2 family glycosyltransferase